MYLWLLVANVMDKLSNWIEGRCFLVCSIHFLDEGLLELRDKMRNGATVMGPGQVWSVHAYMPQIEFSTILDLPVAAKAQWIIHITIHIFSLTQSSCSWTIIKIVACYSTNLLSHTDVRQTDCFVQEATCCINCCVRTNKLCSLWWGNWNDGEWNCLERERKY